MIATTSATALTPDGTLGLNYIGLISPIVAAIQALDREVNALSSTVAGFADNFVSAHITAVTADIQTANIGTANIKNFCAVKSDGTQVCVSGDQLSALLSSQGVSPAACLPPVASPSLIPDATTTSPDTGEATTTDPAPAATASTTTTDATSTASTETTTTAQ